ncbi:MAG: beta-phosphoglucomutase, partial [Clostridia bacterium]|nr:beta-phosphoglucomutase [Clostridia bacterium]
MSLRAVIFDLDGVVTDTAELHYQAWKWLAEREGFSFDRSINEKLKGVGRAESLGIILAHNGMDLPVAKRLALAEEKNQLYVGLLDALDRKNILPGIPAFLQELEKSKILPALCSSSKNTWLILKKLGLGNAFPCVVTGADVMRA